MTLIVATVLIGMTFGAVADSGNAPKPRLTISTADSSLTSMYDDWYYMFEGRRLNRINPDMDMTHLERFERFSGHSDINHDVSDYLIDSRMMYQRMSRTGTPDRSANDSPAGTNMAYPKVSDSGIPLVMSETTSSEYTFTYGITAGDLNGDGRDDVLVFSGTYNSTTYTYTFEYISAINGREGTEIWGQSIVYATGWIGVPTYPVGDLDGDGKEDVIVGSRSYDSDTDEYTVSVYAKRGYDGNLFWSQSVTGDGLYGAFMWADQYCDLDGDGKDDVVVGSWSYDSDTDEETASAYAKRGYDGNLFWSQSVTGEDAFMRPFSYCDLDGDGKDDVIVESGSRRYGSSTNDYAMYAKRGYDGNLFWSQSVTGGGMQAYLYCDLDGDGKDDVVVGSRRCDSATSEYTVSVYAKRGYDGDLFWSQNITCDSWYSAYMRAYLYCDLDGDGKDDVVVGSRRYDSATSEYTVSVYAKRGYNGNLFWSQSVTGEDADMWAYSYCDLDGDGKDDVIVESRSYNSATDESAASVYAKRGYDGNLFWSQSVTGEDVWISAESYCDLDGDSKDDVIVESRSYNSATDESAASVYAKRGYDGDEFWSITDEDIWMETDYYNWYYYSNQDFDGDSLDDLLITNGISIGYDDIPTKVCAVKGNDGTSLWCKPSAPPVTGDLNGDDKLTPADAVIALNIAVSGDYNEYADVNEDGVVNSLDVLMILQAAASSITI